MAIDFEVRAHVAELARRTEQLVREVVLPIEAAHGGSGILAPDWLTTP